MSLQKHLSFRARLAVQAGKVVAWSSRRLGRGSGGMIGGRVALRAHPGVLKELAQGREIVLVTGTNGKSTTTKMVRAALGGVVASNTRGDNMTPGITAALMESAPRAAIEVDEMHLPAVAAAVTPAVIVLLNLSRDQLDRVGEIGTVERRLRQAVEDNPQAVVVANCDDPLIVSAAWDASKVVWVAAGAGWGADSASFPRGGGRVLRDGDQWWVENHPEYRRPQPDYWVETGTEGASLVSATEAIPLHVAIPGSVNLANAAQAVAAAQALGQPPRRAARRLSQVSEVAGRYQTFDVEGRVARLLLAKNPAGWSEALSMADASSVVVAVNGQIPDGEDLSWLWDVDFEDLARASQVVAAGERGADLAVRLEYADIEAPLQAAPLAAITDCPPGPVDVLANYTAFRDLLTVLQSKKYQANPGRGDLR